MLETMKTSKRNAEVYNFFGNVGRKRVRIKNSIKKIVNLLLLKFTGIIVKIKNHLEILNFQMKLSS